MTNAELMATLRYCVVHPFRPCDGCVLFETDGCINVLHGAAADALEATDKRIAELVPKEGEWIVEEIDDSGFKWCKWHCSVCREVIKKGWQHTKDGEKPKWKHCPNCGARMKGW